MEGAVVKPHLYVHNRVACQSALVHSLDDALLDRWDELAGDSATDDGVLELETRAAGERRDLYPRVPKLAAAAGLLLVAPLGLGPARDRLLERHLRGPGIYLHPIPARAPRGYLLPYLPSARARGTGPRRRPVLSPRRPSPPHRVSSLLPRTPSSPPEVLRARRLSGRRADTECRRCGCP